MEAASAEQQKHAPPPPADPAGSPAIAISRVPNNNSHATTFTTTTTTPAAAAVDIIYVNNSVDPDPYPDDASDDSDSTYYEALQADSHELVEMMQIKNLDTGERFTLNEVEKIPPGVDPLMLHIHDRIRKSFDLSNKRNSGSHLDGSMSQSVPASKSPNSTKTAPTPTSVVKKLTESLKSVKEKAIHPDSPLKVVKEKALTSDSDRPRKKLRLFASKQPVHGFSNCVPVQTVGETFSTAIWVMKWSYCGRYLAVGGANDPKSCSPHLRILERLEQFNDHEFFHPTPKVVLRGHTDDILDVSWSPSGHILSSSIDRTVRHWNIDNDDCIHVFLHDDFVSSVNFHPKDENLFISGSLDNKLRFWNIANNQILSMFDCGEFITSTAFVSCGSVAVAGTFNGKCNFCSLESREVVQLKVRSFHGKRSKPSIRKVTGIELHPHSANFLVTCNDARVRLYSDERGLLKKYKGFLNRYFQIKATFSKNGDFLVCGSEDGSVVVWQTCLASINERKSLRGETFRAVTSTPVTVAAFAPPPEGWGIVHHEARYIVCSDTTGTVYVFQNKNFVSVDDPNSIEKTGSSAQLETDSSVMDMLEQ